jgi:hypothetical protein
MSKPISCPFMPFKFLSFFISLLCCAIHANAEAEACTDSGKARPLGALIADAALNEYKEFNGHRINADGYLWKFGSAESETALLRDPESGLPDTKRPGRFAWRRVWEYWLALDKHVSGEAHSRKVLSVPGLLENSATTERITETSLGELLSSLAADDGKTGTALRQAAVRAALNDSPWSAAFISYLMDRLKLTDQEFLYSSAHWQYVQRAFEHPEGYAYQACDPRKTVARAGDLLCYSRGRFPLRNFAEWRSAVQAPGFAAPSHCEVVVNLDVDAKKMDTIGGNVLQSIAMRRLKLNEKNLLSETYNPDRFKTDKSARCARDQACRQPNFNVQYWSVLLQLQ